MSGGSASPPAPPGTGPDGLYATWAAVRFDGLPPRTKLRLQAIEHSRQDVLVFYEHFIEHGEGAVMAMVVV